MLGPVALAAQPLDFQWPVIVRVVGVYRAGDLAVTALVRFVEQARPHSPVDFLLGIDLLAVISSPPIHIGVVGPRVPGPPVPPVSPSDRIVATAALIQPAIGHGLVSVEPR